MKNELRQAIDQIDLVFEESGGGTFLIKPGESARAGGTTYARRIQGESMSRHEEDSNRVFVVADLLDILLPGLRYSEEDLLQVATAFAEKVRTRLHAEFPDRRFAVEIVGEQLVDLEPLELCVTFHTVA